MILVLSIALRIAAVGYALRWLRRLRDGRLAFLAAVFLLMALRQAWTLAESGLGPQVLRFDLHVSELPGLAVSILGLLALVMAARLFRALEREAAAHRKAAILQEAAARVGRRTADLFDEAALVRTVLNTVFDALEPEAVEYFEDTGRGGWVSRGSLGLPSGIVRGGLALPELSEANPKAVLRLASGSSGGAGAAAGVRRLPEAVHDRGFPSAVAALARCGESTGALLIYDRGLRDEQPSEASFLATSAHVLCAALRRARLLKELRESERRFRTLVDLLPHGVQENDLDGVITFSNPAHAAMHGTTPEEMVGRRIWELQDDPRKSEELKRYFETLLRDQPPPVPFFSRDRAGEGRTVDIRVDWDYRRDEVGRLCGFVCVITDITKEKAAEEVLRRHQEELERMVAVRTAELSRANQELDAFSSSVAHDLRAPLRRLELFAREALAEEDASSRRPALNAVVRNATELRERIDGLLHLARLGKVAVRRCPLDMEDVVRETWAEARLLWPSVPAELSVRPLPAVPADPSLARVVWLNLLENALKYAKAGTPLRVEVSARPQDGAVWFAVRDNGIGFERRRAAELFVPFARLDSGAGRPGLGLGLALAARIIERHGGKIEAEGEAGRGAEFRFTFGSEDPAGVLRLPDPGTYCGEHAT